MSILALCLGLIFLNSTPAQSDLGQSDQAQPVPLQRRASAPVLNEPKWAQISGVPSGPTITATSAILIEAANATVLFAKAADTVIAPASLAKIVAIHVTLFAAATGEIDLDEPSPPKPLGWAINQPPGSSLLFLGPDQTVSTRELLAGLVVASGNDAAVEVALRVSATVPQFVDRMNATVRKLGIDELFFHEPAGLSPENRSTASALGRFILAHLAAFPAAPEIYSLREFTYPADTNRTGRSAMDPVFQMNRNGLLWDYAGADGLKTGFIDESGYHLAATAVRDGRRLIAIVMGVDAPSHDEGGRLREEEAAALLDYGFREFRLLEFDLPEVPAIRVYRGVSAETQPIGPDSLFVSAPTGSGSRLAGSVQIVGPVSAPLPPGRALGSVTVSVDGVTIGAADLASREVTLGGFFRRAIDGVALFFSRFGDRRVPTAGTELKEAAPWWPPAR